jgi:hypothetical protein
MGPVVLLELFGGASNVFPLPHPLPLPSFLGAFALGVSARRLRRCVGAASASGPAEIVKRERERLRREDRQEEAGERER